MNKLTWGRKKDFSVEEQSKGEFSDYFKIVFAVGTVICITATALFGNIRVKYTTVSAITDDVHSEAEKNTAVDPFGYFNGEWNLWEFIGDSFSSLLP